MAVSWAPSSIIWWLFTMGPFPLPPGTSVDFFVVLCAEMRSEPVSSATYPLKHFYAEQGTYTVTVIGLDGIGWQGFCNCISSRRPCHTS
jgi:hypothetical protein